MLPPEVARPLLELLDSERELARRKVVTGFMVIRGDVLA